MQKELWQSIELPLKLDLITTKKRSLLYSSDIIERSVAAHSAFAYERSNVVVARVIIDTDDFHNYTSPENPNFIIPFMGGRATPACRQAGAARMNAEFCNYAIMGNYLFFHNLIG